jgi:hypothetical protein
MDDDDPQCIEVMLVWLYTNNNAPEGACTLDSEIAFDADMADLADKYNLPDLAVAVWETVAMRIDMIDLSFDLESHVTAVFSSGRDTKSHRQAKDLIVEGILEAYRSDIRRDAADDWTALILDGLDKQRPSKGILFLELYIVSIGRHRLVVKL